MLVWNLLISELGLQSRVGSLLVLTICRCFCGNYLDENPQFGNGTQFENQCYYTCSGNITTYCGGNALVDIYNNTAFPVPPPPSVEPSVGRYYSKGCYKDLVNGQRALTAASFANDSMTPELCGTFCSTGGRKYRIFGVEYS
jgi:WSC domain